MNVFRERRIAVRCPVVLEHQGQRTEAEAEDLSRRGAFVRTERILPVGAVAELELTLPEGSRLRVSAKVAHALDARTAPALGRSVGMGFVFLEHHDEGRSRLAAYLDRINVEVLSAPAPDVRGGYFVIAHQSAPLAQRVGNILEQIGCEHVIVATGAAAFDACQGRRPDCVVAQVELPDIDGFELLGRLAENFDLVDIPVVLMSSDAAPIQRLRAYRLGAADFIPSPFIDEEVSIRLRRAVAFGLQGYDAAVLRGRLDDIPLASLLSMFEFERKSGVLTLRRAGEGARLYLQDGRVLRVELDHRQGIEALHAMLDWGTGEFEFVACPVVVTDEVGMPSSQLVLSHAQRHDESRR